MIFLKSQKDDFMVKIKELSGYGGLIHFYKDYLETKDESLVNKIPWVQNFLKNFWNRIIGQASNN